MSQGTRHHIIKRHVGAILPLAQMLQHGGLPHLPRARNKNRLEKTAHAQELSLKLSLDVLHSILQIREYKACFIFFIFLALCQGDIQIAALCKMAV